MSSIQWMVGDSMRVFDAKRPLREILSTTDGLDLQWIVLERRLGEAPSFFYAYRPIELQMFASNRPERVDGSAEDALELQETSGSQRVDSSDRPNEIAVGSSRAWQPSMLRLVAVDTLGQPEVVGEIVDWDGTIEPFMDFFLPHTTTAEPDSPDPEVDLGTVRRGNGQSRREPTANGGGSIPSERASAILSAEAPAHIPLKETGAIDVRLELAAGATPLRDRLTTEISLEETIVVIVSVDRRALKVVGPRFLELAAPNVDQPTISSFLVTAVRPGPTNVSIMFRQGATDLGTLTFTITVSEQPSTGEIAAATATAMRREQDDDDVLVLLIEEERIGNRIYYSYLAYSQSLRWNYREFKSGFIKAPKRGAGTAVLRYVRSIYRQILDRVLINHEDLRLFQVELESIGTDMCRQLLDPEFIRAIWDHRDHVLAVQVTTREPYIPWELLRIEHPDTRASDDRFLGEYGLVRSFSGRSGPRDLAAAEWRYLIGTYPLGSQDPLGTEVDYLTTTLPSRGMMPTQVAANLGDLLDVLKEPDFDVLHIACHGKTDLKNVEQSALLITDRRTPRGIQPVTISPTTVLGTARLEKREPLIFLNACETGQHAPSLTDWGGWPHAFWEAGAGAFVGTSWSVYERPATTFAQAFYDSLLGGSTLSEAAAAGRVAAKAIGDGSWLAYVVYGNPLARISTQVASP